jgi:transcriptional regulator with XRE-family HTH domain
MSDFGEKIKSLREERGLTVKDACQQMGIPQSRLSEMERGIRLPTTGQIRILEDFFELDSGDLEKMAASD